MSANERKMKALKERAELNSIIKEKLKEETLQTFNCGKLNDFVVDFYHTFLNTFPTCNTAFLNHHLKTLKIHVLYSKRADDSGLYRCDTRTICLFINNQKPDIKGRIRDLINHELLHLASHNGNEYRASIGFCQRLSFLHKTSIGIGLNEGYTEYLCLKYFSKSKNSTYYVEERILAQKVEEIVGRELMEEAFFDGNLYEIIKSLEKYSDLDESIGIIKEIDNIRKISYLSSERKIKCEEILERLERLSKRKKMEDQKVLKRC